MAVSAITAQFFKNTYNFFNFLKTFLILQRIIFKNMFDFN